MVLCNVDRIILLGSQGKRKIFFEKAIQDFNIDYKFYDYNEVDNLFVNENLNNAVIKIDPPLIEEVKIGALTKFIDNYKMILKRLDGLKGVRYFNEPQAILTLLDKKNCKQKLIDEDIPVTHMYVRDFSCTEELLTFMSENKIMQIFVKPLMGSGAAGVTAVRYAARKNNLVIYTCAALDGEDLVNTKKLMRLENKEAINILDALLQTDCIIEKWHSKARFKEYSYDLRVVMQNGNMDYILPRLSKGPVTNLHLNNHAERYENLGLSKEKTQEIAELCERAVSCFSGLRSAGIDVLLENDKPRIIEMNGQGDLIYQDIYNENKIYKSQIEIIKNIF